VASAARRIWGRWVIQGDGARLFRGVGQGNGVFGTEREGGGGGVVMWVLRSPCLLAEWRDGEWVVGMGGDGGRWAMVQEVFVLSSIRRRSNFRV
jgi:hypothetical protein